MVAHGLGDVLLLSQHRWSISRRVSARASDVRRGRFTQVLSGIFVHLLLRRQVSYRLKAAFHFPHFGAAALGFGRLQQFLYDYFRYFPLHLARST